MRPDATHQRAILAEALQAEEACHALLAAWPEAVLYLSTPTTAGVEKTRGPRSERTPEALRIARALCRTPDEHATHSEAAGLWHRAESLRWGLLPGVERFILKKALPYRSLPGVRVELADLLQEGRLGFLKGCRRYDPDSGLKPLTYCQWWVQAGMTRFIEQAGSTIRRPGHTIEQCRQMEQTRRTLLKQGLPVTPESLAEGMGILPQRVKKLLSLQQPLSLDQPLDGEDDRRLLDTLPGLGAIDLEQRAELALRSGTVARLLATLDDRSATVIRMRFGLDDGIPHTFTEIGTHFGLSRERARQIERDALNRFREALTLPQWQPPRRCRQRPTPTPQPCPRHPGHTLLTIGVCRRCETAITAACRRYRRTGSLPAPHTIAAQALLAVDLLGVHRKWATTAHTMRLQLAPAGTVRSGSPAPSQADATPARGAA